MNDYTLNANVDYSSNQFTASLIYTGIETGFSTATVKVIHPDGKVVNTFNITAIDELYGKTIFAGSGSFGQTVIGEGYDSSYAHPDLSGSYFCKSMTNWEMYMDTGLSSIERDELINLVVDTTVTGIDLSRRTNAYIDSPVVITRGDAVVYGAINTVTSGNYITLTSNRNLTSYTGYNLSKSIVKVLSGTHSGTTFSVTSYTQGQTGFYVDRDCFDYTGEIIALMPYRIINSYSGWSYAFTGEGSPDAVGSGGVLSRFGFTENIPNKVGSISYTSGTYSGIITDLVHPYGVTDLLPLFSGSVVALKNDTYLRDIRFGDIVYFNPASAPLTESTGIIVGVSSHAVAGEGDIAITFWPPRVVDSASTYKIIRNNEMYLQTYPEFNTQYTILASVDGVAKAISTLPTPSASLEFSANEFESTYSIVSETSHFHVGPVVLSNGQTLTGTTSGPYGPSIYFTVDVTHGDPEAPTTVVSKSAFSTQNPDIGHNFGGMYFKDGVLTVAAQAAFNASETLFCTAQVIYGSAKINRVFTIPVQPAI